MEEDIEKAESNALGAQRKTNEELEKAVVGRRRGTPTIDPVRGDPESSPDHNRGQGR